MRSSKTVTWLMASAILLGTSIVAEAKEVEPVEALPLDVERYAKSYGIPVDEAERLFTLGAAGGDLEQVLMAAEADSFAGMWLEHGPEPVVVILSTSPMLSLGEYVDGTALEGYVELREARYTLHELQEMQASVMTQEVPEGIDFATTIDSQENTVVIEAPPGQAMVYFRDNPVSGPVVVVEHELPVPAVDIYGGMSLSNGCTTGFSIEQINGFEQGVTTAGHCDDQTSWNGYNLPWQDGQKSGNTDAQWHTTPGLADPNKIKCGGCSGNPRTILSRVGRANQIEGNPICKYGRVTGYECGTLDDKNYDPSDNCVAASSATWMRASGPEDMAQPGDSGGPVFVGNGAYGTINCHFTNNDDMIYMAQNYLSNIGVQVDI